jgi:hypothetical protein
MKTINKIIGLVVANITFHFIYYMFILYGNETIVSTFQQTDICPRDNTL